MHLCHYPVVMLSPFSFFLLVVHCLYVYMQYTIPMNCNDLHLIPSCYYTLVFLQYVFSVSAVKQGIQQPCWEDVKEANNPWFCTRFAMSHSSKLWVVSVPPVMNSMQRLTSRPQLSSCFLLLCDWCLEASQYKSYKQRSLFFQWWSMASSCFSIKWINPGLVKRFKANDIRH